MEMFLVAEEFDDDSAAISVLGSPWGTVIFLAFLSPLRGARQILPMDARNQDALLFSLPTYASASSDWFP